MDVVGDDDTSRAESQGDAAGDETSAGCADPGAADDVSTGRHRRLGKHVPLAVAVAGLLVLTSLAGWFGFRVYESHRLIADQKAFVQVARQGALNLTTINYTSADTDVQRIIDSAKGTFRDDFQQRAQPFIAVVKQSQAKSEGTIAEAALESQDGDSARVLVAVTVQSWSAGAEQDAKSWRMRIVVQGSGERAKVSNVEFVP